MFKIVMVGMVLSGIISFGSILGIMPMLMVPSVMADDIYPDYLWGDPNYECAYGHMYIGSYIDWSSAVLTSDGKDGSGRIQFAVNVLRVDMRTNTVVGQATFEYIDDSDPGFYCRVNGGEWNTFDPNQMFGYNATNIIVYKKCMDRLLG